MNNFINGGKMFALKIKKDMRFQKLKYIISSFKTIYKMTTSKSKYNILELYIDSREITIQIKGRILVKLKIDEAVDVNLLKNLNPDQACWTGFYYGKFLKTSKHISKRSNQNDFFLDASLDRYEIRFETRNGSIGYIDKFSKNEFTEHPIDIIKNKYVVERFGPTQAFYIGMLAGIHYEKLKAKKENIDFMKTIFLSKRKPVLKSVISE